MKIGIFDPYLDTLGGGEKYMLSIAACLSHEHQVSLLWDDPSIIDRAGKRFSLDLSKMTLSPNIFASQFSFLQKLQQSRQYDAIIYLSDGSLPIVLSRKLFIHFQFPVEWVKISLFDRLKIARITNIFCNSQFTKSFIDNKFRVASAVIYPPISLPQELPLSAEKKNIILTVGRWQRDTKGSNFKKQDMMIETFKKLIDSGLKNWELVIVVSYREEEKSDETYLKKLVKGYPIRLETDLPYTDLQDWYKQAKIYWHAAGYGEDIATHPEMAEHFGMTTVEAMGYGCVPIVINAGGQKEIVTDNKNGLLWNTPEELMEKTMVLIGDKNVLSECSRAAQRRANDFNKEKFCESIINLVIK